MNNMNRTNLSLNYYQFGPIIAAYLLPDSIISELRVRGKQTNLDHRHSLAGHIEKENAFSKEDKEWFINNTSNIFQVYLDLLIDKCITKDKKPQSLQLSNLWINFMKNGDFNPPHNHDGDISFVIYTSVPNELKEENDAFKGRSAGPGTIEFLYGESNKSYRTAYSFLPKTGDMFLFPASLRHFVSPFKSDITRESVSGNIYFTY